MRLKINLQIPQIKIICYTSVVLVFLTSVVFSWGFLYKNFFLVITQSTEIMNVQRKVPIETINLSKFENIIKKINDKTIIKDDYINTIKNPFN